MQRRSHSWTQARGRCECQWCGMRRHWEGADSPCSGVIPDMERNPETRRVASKERSRMARQRAREAMTVQVLSEEQIAKRAQQAEYTRRWREKRTA